MPTILTKKSDTPGAVPATANLTNAAGGAELAVNTADKRLFTLNSSSAVVEIGTNPSSLTCADVSATVLQAGSATITNLTATSATIDNFTFTSATVTRLAATSAVITDLSATVGRIDSGTITQLTSTSATVTTLTGTSANITTLTGSSMNVTTATHASADITTLTGTTFGTTATTHLRGASANITTITSGSANLTQLQSTSATITTLTSTSASVTNLTATSLVLSNLSIASANVTTLTSASATITNLLATTLTISGGSANGVLYLNASKVATSDGTNFVFDGSNLRVGNGTGNPTQRLEVVNAGSVTARIWSATNTTPVASLEFQRGTNATWGADAFGDFRISNDTGDLIFQYGESGVTTERFRISGTDVVIGNGSSSASPANGVLRGTNGSGTDITGATLTIQGGRGTGSGAGGPIVFSTSAAGASGTTLRTATERMRITSAGDVGIGTSSPGAQLHIVGNDTSDQVIIENTDAGALTAPDMVFYRNSASPAASDAIGNLVYRGKDSAGNDQDYARILSLIEDPTSATEDGNLVFQTALNSACDERMRITAAGDVGIGTTSPLSLLDVSGTAPVLTLNDSRASATWSAGTALGKLDFYTSDITGIGAHSVASIGVVAGGSNTASPDGVLVFSTGAYNTVATEKMRITSAGDVGIGTTSPSTKLDVVGDITVQSTTFDTDGGALNFYNTDASINSGQALGRILFSDKDATGSVQTTFAYIYGVASGTHAAGDNPTDIAFGTTPNNTGTVAEAGRITESGSYVLKGGNTNPGGVGIVFPATQVASADANSLDDYEEGAWTPTYVPTTGAFTSVTYDGATLGRYTKIGNTVFCTGTLRTDAITVGTASGGLLIGGLPFTVNAAGPQGVVSVGYVDAFAGDAPFGGTVSVSTTTAFIWYRTTSNGGSTQLDVTDLGTGANSNYMAFNIIYTV